MKDRLRFAAVEAKQRGQLGIRYIARVIGCSEKTIERELAELENLIACFDVRTAGDPDKEDAFYTHMTPRELSSRLAEMGTPTGRDSIATWLDDAGIRHCFIR